MGYSVVPTPVRGVAINDCHCFKGKPRGVEDQVVFLKPRGVARRWMTLDRLFCNVRRLYSFAEGVKFQNAQSGRVAKNAILQHPKSLAVSKGML